MRRSRPIVPATAASSARPSPAPMSRRGFLTGSGLTLGALAAGGTLAGCSKPESAAPGASTLTIATWPDYIDTGNDGTVARFQRETGIRTDYTESLTDNERFFQSIVPDMTAGRGIDPDIVVVTDWMAARLIGLGWLQPLNLDRAPNAANLTPELENPPWDLVGNYTLPWQSGMVVIAYNENETGFEVTGLDDLFDERLKGRVSLLSEFRDTLGTLGIDAGIDITQPRLGAFDDVFERLDRANSDGQIHSYTGNEYVDGLVSGELAASLAWSGDVAQVAVDHPEIKLVVPQLGTVLFSDVMGVPKGSPNLDAAMQWMDFVYDPSNAAKVTEYVQYISPVSGVDDRLRAMGDEAAALVDNPLVFPVESTRSGLQSFGVIAPTEETDFEDRFARIVAGAA